MGLLGTNGSDSKSCAIEQNYVCFDILWDNHTFTAVDKSENIAECCKGNHEELNKITLTAVDKLVKRCIVIIVATGQINVLHQKISNIANCCL